MVYTFTYFTTDQYVPSLPVMGQDLSGSQSMMSATVQMNFVIKALAGRGLAWNHEEPQESGTHTIKGVNAKTDGNRPHKLGLFLRQTDQLKKVCKILSNTVTNVIASRVIYV